MYTCEIKNLSAQPVLSVHTRTPVQNLPAILGQTYFQVIQRLGELGEDPAGPPFVGYFNMDMNDLDVEIGFPVRAPLEGQGAVQAGEIPAGMYAVTLHKGPYTTVDQAYNALTEFVQGQGHSMPEISYEFYLNDPNETAPEELLTQIFFPVNE
jgi:effector-binding domain-containing protein